MLQRPVRVTLFLEGDVADALEALAAGEDALFSEYVRRVLTRHVASKLSRRARRTPPRLGPPTP